MCVCVWAQLLILNASQNGSQVGRTTIQLFTYFESCNLKITNNNFLILSWVRYFMPHFFTWYLEVDSSGMMEDTWVPKKIHQPLTSELTNSLILVSAWVGYLNTIRDTCDQLACTLDHSATKPLPLNWRLKRTFKQLYMMHNIF